MGAIRRGTTFLALAQGAWTAIRNTAQPLQRFRLASTATVAEIARVFNLFEESVHDATIGSRSLPFGGPCALFESVSFAGAPVTLPNVLKSAKVFPLLCAPSVAASSPWLVAWSLSSDGAQIILTPGGTFTAHVILMVTP